MTKESKCGEPGERCFFFTHIRKYRTTDEKGDLYDVVGFCRKHVKVADARNQACDDFFSDKLASGK